ncbi:MAG: M6 family metalloprotease domain-containing protein, partial [Bacteroidales bacterium]|nr:M6 family metalloprotease domain-containing protein [Bacteroidales bacterium]
VYDDILNHPSEASLKRYYEEVSYGQLSVSSFIYPVPPAATVISYQDSYPRDYYSPYNSITNPTGYATSTESSSRKGVLLRNAVNHISSQVPAGLDIDSDDDGNVDNVVFIVYGSPTGWGSLLWPHRSTLSSSYAAYINGARVYDYNFTLQSSTLASRASTLAHEMFHSLGAPDLYHYTDNNMTPVGVWDLMASNQRPPQHMTAYMKWRYGKWIDSIPEIRQSGVYELNPLVSPTDNCFKIKVPGNDDEFFVLEYRKRTGIFEPSLPTEGLLIYRVNMSIASGNRNGPPDAVYVFRPGGTLRNNGTSSEAPFSLNTFSTVFNNNTDPPAFQTNGSKGNISISDIGSTGSTITFRASIAESYAYFKEPIPQSGLISGTKKRIEWDASDDTGTMILEFSADGGYNWTIISEDVNSPFDWTVPAISSIDCRLRMTSVAVSGVSDIISFSIAPNFPYLLADYNATDITGAGYNSGLAILPNEFWTSRNNSSRIHRWNYSGGLIEEFTLTGVSNLLSLTFDGTFVYGVRGTTSYIYVIDPTSKALLSTISLAQPVSNIAFDPSAIGGSGGFWISGSTGDIILVNRNGTEMTRIPELTHKLTNISGLAIETDATGKVCLWCYVTAGNIPGSPQYVVQLGLPAGTQTGNFHNILLDVGLTAGNPDARDLAFGIDSYGRVLMGGINGGTPNWVFFYDFSNSDSDPVMLNVMEEPYTENFDAIGIESVNQFYDNITIPGVYAFRTIGNSVPNEFYRSSGGSNLGRFYSYGIASTEPGGTDRALGGICSSATGTLYYGFRIRNNTGTTITSLDIGYTGEQWRTGGSSTVQIPNTLEFGFQQAPRVYQLTSGNFEAVEELSFISPTLTPVATSLDGSLSVNRRLVSGILEVLIPDGEEIMLRWVDTDDASFDHAFGIDDLTIVPRAISTRDEIIGQTRPMLRLYPNPAGDILYIDGMDHTKSEVIITDLTGKPIVHFETENIEQINISMLKPGLYLILVKHGESVSTGKFIK